MPSPLWQASLLTVPDQAEVQYRVPLPSFSLDDNSGHTESLKNVSCQGLPVSTHPYYQDVLHQSTQIICHERKLLYLPADLPMKYFLTA